MSRVKKSFIDGLRIELWPLYVTAIGLLMLWSFNFAMLVQEFGVVPAENADVVLELTGLWALMLAATPLANGAYAAYREYKRGDLA